MPKGDWDSIITSIKASENTGNVVLSVDYFNRIVSKMARYEAALKWIAEEMQEHAREALEEGKQ